MPKRRPLAGLVDLDPVSDISGLAKAVGFAWPVGISRAAQAHLKRTPFQDQLGFEHSRDVVYETRLRSALVNLRNAIIACPDSRDVFAFTAFLDLPTLPADVILPLQARVGPRGAKDPTYLIELYGELHETDPFELSKPRDPPLEGAF